jgi:hypothetical protein
MTARAGKILKKVQKRFLVKLFTPYKNYMLYLLKGPFGVLCDNFLSFTGVLSRVFVKKRTGVILNKSAIQVVLLKLEEQILGLNYLHKKFINLVGIGSKIYNSKIRNKQYLAFKMGLGAAMLGYKVPLNIRVRARKQKLILVSPFKDKLNDIAEKIICLKRPNAYTGKGFIL